MIDEVKYGPSTKIADIDFISARLANVLSSIGIKNLSDLKSFVGKNKTESLLKTRNFGHKSLEELRQLVSALETSDVLCGRESCDAWVCSDSQKYDKKADFANRIDELPVDTDDVIYIPNILLEDLGDNCDDLKFLLGLNIKSTSDLFLFCSKNHIAYLFKLYKTDAFKTSWALKIVALLTILWDRNKWTLLFDMFNDGIEHDFSLLPVPRPTTGLFSDVDESCLGEVTELVQRQFLTRLSSLSGRCQNVITSEMPCFGDVIIHSILYSKRYIRNCGKNTRDEINLLAINISNDIQNLSASPINPINALAALQQISYRCETDDEKKFITQFYNKYGHLPMFYLLASYISKSEDFFEKLYKYTYGIHCASISLRKVAKMLDKTYERCRYLISTSNLYDKHPVKNESIMNLEYWESYHLEDVLYLTPNSPIYKRVIESECLTQLSFVGFGYLCKLLLPFRFISVDGNNYFFSKQVVECCDIKAALVDVAQALSRKVTQDVTIPIAKFLNDRWSKTCDLKKKDISKMLSVIILENFDVQIDKYHRITVRQNAIDVATELYEIIKANKHPMVLEDILTEFNNKHPQIRFTKPERIRYCLTHDDRIRPIGKSACYSLREWNFYIGTIRDLICDTLSKSSRPLTAKELHAHINKVYDTTPRNIRSSIVCDKLGRFVLLNGGYIGLASKEYPGEFY